MELSRQVRTLRERLRDVVASWQGGKQPAVLEAQSLQLAVARGAAYGDLSLDATCVKWNPDLVFGVGQQAGVPQRCE